MKAAEDSNLGICSRFYADIVDCESEAGRKFDQLQAEYNKKRSSGFSFEMEKIICGGKIDKRSPHHETVYNLVRQLGMEL